MSTTTTKKQSKKEEAQSPAASLKSMSEKEYAIALATAKEEIKPLLSNDREYSSIIGLLFPEFASPDGKKKLRRVWNWHTFDETVVKILQQVPAKIKSLQNTEPVSKVA